MATIAASRAHAVMRDQVAEERVRASEAAARSKAIDEMLSSLRVEERTFRRTDGRPIAGAKKPIVLEERICLGCLPVSTWARQELSVYAGAYGLPMSPTTPETYPKPKLLGLERR